MKSFLLLLLCFAIAFAAWRFLSAKLTAYGHPRWKVRTVSGVVSFVVLVVVAGLILPAPPPAPAKAVEQKEQAKVAQEAKAEVTAPAAPKVAEASSEDQIKVRVSKLNSNITDVSVVGDTVVITHLHTAIWDGKHWVSSFFMDAKDIVQQLPEALGNVTIKRVTFLVQTPTVNDMGKKDKQLGMKVVYDLPPFKGANWDDMSAWNMANLPENIQFKRLGLESAVEYCKDEDNLKYATPFCRRVVNQLPS